MLQPEQAKEIDAHLVEYKALRDEINLYAQRGDRVVSLYLTAVLAILGFFLQPGRGTDWAAYAAQVRSSHVLTGLLLLVALVNSALLTRVAAFNLAILSMAQYTDSVVGKRLSLLVRSSVMRWDRDEGLVTKRLWLPVRASAQLMFGVLSLGLSIGILVYARYSLWAGRELAALYLLRTRAQIT